MSEKSKRGGEKKVLEAELMRAGGWEIKHRLKRGRGSKTRVRGGGGLIASAA